MGSGVVKTLSLVYTYCYTGFSLFFVSALAAMTFPPGITAMGSVKRITGAPVFSQFCESNAI